MPRHPARPDRWLRLVGLAASALALARRTAPPTWRPPLGLAVRALRALAR